MDRTELLAALRELGDLLQRERVVARVYVVGGAAMALAYDSERATRDIDAIVLDHHTAVMSAVREIARRHGWPSTWFNEQAAAYAPPVHDGHAVAVFDHPALRVLAASADHLLAMKARAARATDRSDLVRLAAMTGCVTADDVEALVHRYFPEDGLPARSRLVIEDWLG